MSQCHRLDGAKLDGGGTSKGKGRTIEKVLTLAPSALLPGHLKLGAVSPLSETELFKKKERN